ncbi:MAG: MATE family efflux transporter [Bacteroidaceae bacterium]|nr:MATE family efflux transporter [Bacteroidaceae bacterium]
MSVDTQQQKFQHMTTMPVDRLVRQLALPTVISMLITAIYNMADTFFVGQLGASAQGAIGVVYSLMMIIQAIGFGFGHGSGNYISRKLGEQNVLEAAQMAVVGFVSSFFTGLLVLLAGLLFMPQIALILGSTLTILPYAEEYMFFILLAAPFYASSLTLNNQLRLQGCAQRALLGIGTGALLNCALDPLLIFGFHMGVTGAGLSTLISQIFSFLILLYQTQHSDAVSLSLRLYRPYKGLLMAIMQGGLPSVSRQGIHSLANILLSHAMKFYGDQFFAAMTIVVRLSNLLFASVAGIGQGFQPVCGFNYGARLYSRVHSAYIYTQRLALTTLSIATLVLLIFTPQIIAFFSQSPQVIALSVQAQRWQCISIPFMGFCIIVSMLLQNINHYKQATVMALSRSGIFFIPAILLMPSCLGMLGVMLAQPVADFCSFALALPMQRRVMRQLKQPDAIS